MKIIDLILTDNYLLNHLLELSCLAISSRAIAKSKINSFDQFFVRHHFNLTRVSKVK